MLEFLKIENLALLEKASIDFHEGFTVVTGETGAGKSVLLGALSMLAGNRCGKEIIKSGKDFCSVEASFNFSDTSKIDAFLESEGLPELESGNLILRRVIHKTKSAKCFINGALVPLSSMQKLGEFWVDFHGPGEPQKLFSQKNQLELLDIFADLLSQKEPYLKLLDERRETLKKIEELKNAKQMDSDEIEFVRLQIDKIERFDPSEESVAELENSYKILENALEISENSAASSQIISGEDSAMDKLSTSKRLLDEIADSSEEASGLSDRLSAIIIELGDIASDLDSLSRNCSFSEEEAQEIRTRMEDWLSIRRKYGKTVAEVLSAKEKMQERLSIQGDVKKNILLETEKLERIESEMQPIAESIFKSRNLAATKLSKKVISLLQKLGFKKPDFKISIKKDSEFSAMCGSVCEFEFSANPGQDVLPLVKIASSGELARVMLAIKTTMANADKTPLLVFDEVDANVGGEIGVAVAGELANLAGSHQVFCVTHLPQVASFGRTHLLVKKTQSSDSTSVEISELEGESRIFELARMLGDRNSPSAITHARELLSKSNLK